MAAHHWLNGSRAGAVGAGGRVQAPGAQGGAGGSVPLPPSRHLPAETLERVLHARRSRYDFDRAPFPLEVLSAMLRHAVGLGRRVEGYGRPDHPLNVAPSAGGLNSVTTYIAAALVDGLEPGFYRFDPEAHAVVERAPGDPRPGLAACYLQPQFADQSPLTLMLVARLLPALDKYPPRHYRTLHIDAGIAAQNLYLVGTALGLHCCAVAGYQDEAVRDVLALDQDEFATLLFAVGQPPSR